MSASFLKRSHKPLISSGGISFSSSMLKVASTSSTVIDGAREVQLLDRQGTVVSLPMNLIDGYARYVALLNIKSSCRYQVKHCDHREYS
jgi:hypothetical protein